MNAEGVFQFRLDALKIRLPCGLFKSWKVHRQADGAFKSRTQEILGFVRAVVLFYLVADGIKIENVDIFLHFERDSQVVRKAGFDIP